MTAYISGAMPAISGTVQAAVRARMAKWQMLSQLEYDALSSPDPDTVYVISPAAVIWRGQRIWPDVTGDYPSAVLEDEPIAYYRLAETGGGTIASDSSPHNRHATWGTGRRGTGPFPGSGAADLGGPTAAVMIPSTVNVGSALNGPPVSMECWQQVKADNTARPGQNVLVMGTVGGNNTCRLYSPSAPSGLPFAPGIQRGWTGFATSGVLQPFADGIQWFHVVAVASGADRTVYLNGIPVTTGIESNLGAGVASGGMIGSPDNTIDTSAATWNTGLTSEVAIYDHALSGDRIAVHYATGLAAMEES